ncbi:uncharacterized protein [Trachinotus anak]|uniref:uncharacterized protein isoform X2 n=1 Tax=Trachinotus anak TaxID=443729 RepID=UPI0039F1EF44
MLTMNADKWIFHLAVCFMCVSSSDEQYYEESCHLCLEVGETHTLSAPLGSSMLLPCSVANSNLNWVSWAHATGGDLVRLTSEGHIKFLLPKSGRVKAFPNQGSKGNFSIYIDEIEDSDLGVYCCLHEDHCLQVELVAATDEQYYEESCHLCSEVGETHTLSAPLGSSMLLPCSFANSNLNWVSWAHATGGDLVRLTSEGRIKFLLPKSGRVKAFPNQGSKGNFSIYIDEIEDSDLGVYCCLHENDCLQVELVAATGTSAPPAVTGIVPVRDQQRGAHNNNLVYENDDQDPANQMGDPTRSHHNLPGGLHDVDRMQPTQSSSGIYPNLNQFNFERAASQRTKQRFHRELINRLRQASFSRHHYVNQGEISRQQAMSAQAENHHQAGLGKKKAKEKHEYNNPIYNRSTDQLNHL